MACMGRFFVLGPPTARSREVLGVASHVMMTTKNHSFKLEQMVGPAKYDASWVDGGRKSPRDGMQAIELWTGNVEWSDADSATSFTVVVMDHVYLCNREERRKDGRVPKQEPQAPTFETFIVIVLRNGHRGVRAVYELRALAERHWRNRSDWYRPVRGPERTEALAMLRTETWEPLHNLESLLTQKGAHAQSRRSKNTLSRSTKLGIEEVLCSKTLDVILPYGLPKFLSALAPRPPSYEELCRVLWERETDGDPHASLPTSMPPWYRTPCATERVTSDDLPDWWWGGLLGPQEALSTNS